LKVKKNIKMKKYIRNASRPRVLFCILALAAMACTKTNPHSTVAAVNVINASPGSPSIYVSFWGDSAYYTAPTVSYGSYLELSIPAKNASLYLATDTTKPFFNGPFPLIAGQIWSLFLAGQGGVPDSFFVRDYIHKLAVADSVTGVRFVNMAQGSNPINIDIRGASGPVTTNLQYKGVVGWQSFSANAAATTAGYTFEFRDNVSDSLLASYPLTFVSNVNQTLVFYGAAASGFSVMSENNY
jgi:hypothetical protein